MERRTTMVVEDFDGGRKHMWVGVKRILGKQAGEADTGIATLKAHTYISVK